MNILFKKIIFILLFSLLFNFFIFLFFKDIFLANSIIITFSVHPFDLCTKYYNFWCTFKKVYIITSFFSSIIISNYLLIKFKNLSIFINNPQKQKSNLDTNYQIDNNLLSLFVGTDEENNNIYVFALNIDNINSDDLAKRINIVKESLKALNLLK